MSLHLSHTIRDSSTLKCEKPEKTIKHLEQKFEDLGFELSFSFKKYSKRANLYSGRLSIPSLGIGSNGKGLSPELAKASALAELVERITSGNFFRDIHYLENRSSKNNEYNKILSDIITLSNMTFVNGYNYSSEADLKNALPIEDLLNHSPYLSQEAIQKIKQNDICKHWVDGYSLLQNEKMKIPLKFIQNISASNGLAAGNTLEEAIVQASCEIFERYVSITTLRSEKILPTIDTKTIPFESVRKLIAFLRKKNITVIVKDFSFGGLFPCYGMMFINNNFSNTKNPLKKTFQYKTFRVGASFNTEEALLRCFTEHFQGKTIANFTKWNNFDLIWNDFLKTNIQNYQPPNSYISIFRRYLFSGDLSFLEKGEIIGFPQSELLYDCYEEIERIKNICKKLNSELLVVDHTHPAFSFPVVRVIIPGYSDILSYHYNGQKDFDDYLFQVVSNNLHKDLVVSDRYYVNNDWLKDKKALQILVDELLGNMKKTPTIEYSSMVFLLNELNIFHTLSCIYYQLQDFDNFSLCMKVLSKIYPNMRRQFIYLALLAKYNQTELNKLLQGESPQRNLFINNKNPKNPFTDWFNPPDSKANEKERLTSVRRLLDIFL